MERSVIPAPVSTRYSFALATAYLDGGIVVSAYHICICFFPTGSIPHVEIKVQDDVLR